MRLMTLTAAALAVTLTGAARADDLSGLPPAERAIAEDFARLNESGSPRWDHQTIHAYAGLRRPFVVRGLLGAYALERPRYGDELRAMLAAALGRQRAAPEDREALRAFARKVAARSEHAWALYQAQSLLARWPEERRALRQVVTRDDEAWRRIAALRALSRSGDQAWLLDVEAWIASALDSRGRHRGLLLNALAWSVAESGLGVDPALIAMIEELQEHESLSRRTRLHIGYALEHARGPEAPPAKADGGGGTVERPGRFMSIDADGERVLFVLDASDSMLEPLSDSERRAFRALLTPEQHRDHAGLISGMRTRFDAARVHLILALLGLSRHQRFAVITFGGEARLWPATPGFVRASKSATRKVAASLASGLPAESGTVTRGEEPGMMGNTNLYRALQLAFRVGARGAVATARPELHPGLTEEGADMIFLLSDGVPIEDGLAGETPELEQQVNIAPGKPTGRFRDQPWEERDPETGRLIRRGTTRVPVVEPAGEAKLVTVRRRGRYDQGPFVGPRIYPFGIEAIRDELRRLNLFRRVIVHAVAFGEADIELMRSLARQEHGRFLRVGR